MFHVEQFGFETRRVEEDEGKTKAMMDDGKWKMEKKRYSSALHQSSLNFFVPFVFFVFKSFCFAAKAF
jgi:hypothetical protein